MGAGCSHLQRPRDLPGNVCLQEARDQELPLGKYQVSPN